MRFDDCLIGVSFVNLSQQKRKGHSLVSKLSRWHCHYYFIIKMIIIIETSNSKGENWLFFSDIRKLKTKKCDKAIFILVSRNLNPNHLTASWHQLGFVSSVIKRFAEAIFCTGNSILNEAMNHNSVKCLICEPV